MGNRRCYMSTEQQVATRCDKSLYVLTFKWRLAGFYPFEHHIRTFFAGASTHNTTVFDVAAILTSRVHIAASLSAAPRSNYIDPAVLTFTRMQHYLHESGGRTEQHLPEGCAVVCSLQRLFLDGMRRFTPPLFFYVTPLPPGARP